MCWKADDSGPLTLTKSARCARHVVANRGRTDYNFAPRWRRRVRRLITGEHNYDRAALSVGEFIRVRQSVCAQIHCESVQIGRAYSLTIRLRSVFVRVRKATAARVRLCELAERVRVYFLANTRQIPGLVMPPKLTTRKPANSRAEVIPI